jgi:hypothetical protein
MAHERPYREISFVIEPHGEIYTNMPASFCSYRVTQATQIQQ